VPAKQTYEAVKVLLVRVRLCLLIFTCIIHGYSTLGQWKETTKVFREMTPQCLLPNIVTWNVFPLQAWQKQRSCRYFFITHDSQGPPTWYLLVL
jgi:pentatricopeptide repeat protein